MGFQVSAGVNISEIDLTTVVPAVSTTEGATAGVFRWGPANEATLISSESDLVKRFGTPTNDNFETFFNAAAFLAYGNKLYVSRAVDLLANNAVANTASVVGTQLNNKTKYETTSLPANALYFAKYPGVIGNSLKVSICDSANAFSQTLSSTIVGHDVNNTVITFGFPVGSSNATITVTNTLGNSGNAAANTENNLFLASLNVGDFLAFGNTTVGTQQLQITSLSTSAITTGGTSVSTIGLSGAISLGSSFTSSTLARKWEYADLCQAAPGKSTYVSSLAGTTYNDELHVAVIDAGGLFSGTRGTVLELYEAVSRATDAKSEQGGSIYYKDLINTSSKYLWWGGHRAGAGASTGANVAASTNYAPASYTLAGGTDGSAGAEDTIAVGQLTAAYDVFKNPDEIDVSLVLAGKARGGTNGELLANYLIDNIAEARRDCLVFVSPDRADVVNNVNGEATASVVFRNSLRSTSYAVLDSGYKYVYDRYNDVYRYVPLNGDIAGLCVRTDETRDPWFSPAGFNRGQVKNIVKLAYNPDKATRDVLYKAGINPVVSFPGQGVVLYGDKTLLSKPSAFDRINVRRLFIVLEKAIATASKFSLFEFNDDFTRAQFRNMTEPFLRDIQGRRGIYDFKVVCDDTNNTGEIIDRNEFVGDIYVKPARSINFIQLNFVAVRTGVAFSEVVGQF